MIIASVTAHFGYTIGLKKLDTDGKKYKNESKSSISMATKKKKEVFSFQAIYTNEIIF